MPKAFNEKIDSIEDKIKKLKEQKKRMREKLERQIGRLVIETWSVESIEEAKQYVDMCKEQISFMKESAPTTQTPQSDASNNSATNVIQK